MTHRATRALRLRRCYRPCGRLQSGSRLGSSSTSSRAAANAAGAADARHAKRQTATLPLPRAAIGGGWFLRQVAGAHVRAFRDVVRDDFRARSIADAGAYGLRLRLSVFVENPNRAAVPALRLSSLSGCAVRREAERRIRNGQDIVFAIDGDREVR